VTQPAAASGRRRPISDGGRPSGLHRQVRLPAGQLAIGLLVLAAAAVAIGVAISSGGGSTRTVATVVTGPASPSAPPANSEVHQTRTPFLAHGARFAVFANPGQAWTATLRASTPKGGGRWEAVEVLVHNLNQHGFDPRVLHYRLQDSRGLVYIPSPSIGDGGVAGNPAKAQPVAVGKLTKVELAFAIPRGHSGLRLLFEPALHDRVQTIAVPLGG
jgi:hypothetical protein